MKKKFMPCQICNKETIHSISKRTSPINGKTKRNVDRCDECQTTTIDGGRTGKKIYKKGLRQ